jgi:hypothetical protein
MNKELYDKLSPEAQHQLNEALHETLCESSITLIKDTIENPGLTKEEVQSARDFADLKPDTDAAREFLEFLDSDIVKDALIK